MLKVFVNFRHFPLFTRDGTEKWLTSDCEKGHLFTRWNLDTFFFIYYLHDRKWPGQRSSISEIYNTYPGKNLRVVYLATGKMNLVTVGGRNLTKNIKITHYIEEL